MITLGSGIQTYNYDDYFFLANRSQKCDFKTSFQLETDLQHLTIHFNCFDNPFTDFNTLNVHNQALYHQEVFEFFISLGKEENTEYLEFEINPNNAMWIGKIKNPLKDGKTHQLSTLFLPEPHLILHSVQKNENSWGGMIKIPWFFIGKSEDGFYRINICRIRAKTAPTETQWIGNSDNCDFVSWQKLKENEEPAFHFPQCFALIKINS